MSTTVTGARVSLLLNWYSEESFLPEMWSAVAPLVDEVVVVAGPYAFAVEALETFGLAVNRVEAEERIRAVVGQTSLTFVEAVWETEDAKRVAGYEACTGDLILIVDADEVVQITADRIAEFAASEFAVGRIDVVNVASSTAAFGDAFYDYVERFPQKTVLFRRQDVSAIEHINYLWLVGVAQDTTALEAADPVSLGLMIHLTGPRSMRDHATRVIFYRALYFRTESEEKRVEFIADLRRFAGWERAYLTSSEDSLGISDRFTYRPIPSVLVDLGEFWDDLQSKAEAYENDRRQPTPMDEWPLGAYVPFAVRLSGRDREWRLTLPERFTILGFSAVHDDGRFGELVPLTTDRTDTQLTFTCAADLALFPPMVRVWG